MHLGEHSILTLLLSKPKLKDSLQVEAALMVSPYVENIMMHADPFHTYSVALVVASEPALRDWAIKQGISFNDFQDLFDKDETVREVCRSLLQVCLQYSCF